MVYGQLMDSFPRNHSVHSGWTPCVQINFATLQLVSLPNCKIGRKMMKGNDRLDSDWTDYIDEILLVTCLPESKFSFMYQLVRQHGQYYHWLPSLSLVAMYTLATNYACLGIGFQDLYRFSWFIPSRLPWGIHDHKRTMKDKKKVNKMVISYIYT